MLWFSLEFLTRVPTEVEKIQTSQEEKLQHSLFVMVHIILFFIIILNTWVMSYGVLVGYSLYKLGKSGKSLLGSSFVKSSV